MKWRAVLLVCVAIASGLLSVLHMYLLSGTGGDIIRVALEVPLPAGQPHSANVEVNIQSLVQLAGEVGGKDSAQQESDEDRAGQVPSLAETGVPVEAYSVVGNDGVDVRQSTSSERAQELAQYNRHSESDPQEYVLPGEYGGEGDGEVAEGEGEEVYSVLLDTGDYELEERDMDSVVDSPAAPTQTSHRAARGHKRRHRTIEQPHGTVGPTSLVSEQLSTQDDIVSGRDAVESKLSAAGAGINGGSAGQHSPSTEGTWSTTQPEQSLLESQGAGRGAADVVAAEAQYSNGSTGHSDLRNEQRSGGLMDNRKGVIVMSKEEYYARQASASRPTTPSPQTRASQATHGPNHTHKQCLVPPCLENLTPVERSVFNKCQKRTVPHRGGHSVPGCQCRFVEGAGRKRVALVSLPGSGNTWVRGLLEKATGVCTGSIYCDRTLREGGFCGEGLHGSSLVVVKTHDSSLQWRGGRLTDSSRPVFDKAIFLVRNPFRANIAEWNRQVSKKYAPEQTGSSHVKHVSSKAFFGTQVGWQALVKYQAHKWRLMIGSNLVARAGRPVLPIFFEDLKLDPAPQLVKMLDFLEVPLSPDLINATLQDGYTSYYRNHTDSFEHYTAEQKVLVNGIIARTAETLQSKALDHFASRIREYIMH